MLLLAQNVDYYLDSTPPDVFSLTCMFFFLNFLAATQDIAGNVLISRKKILLIFNSFIIDDIDFTNNFFQSTVGL